MRGQNVNVSEDSMTVGNGIKTGVTFSTKRFSILTTTKEKREGTESVLKWILPEEKWQRKPP